MDKKELSTILNTEFSTVRKEDDIVLLPYFLNEKPVTRREYEEYRNRLLSTPLP
jgi:hypothetical protein